MGKTMTRSGLLISMAFFFLIGLSFEVLAQEGPPPPQEGGRGRGFQMPNFSELDKNKDKKLSRDEVPSQFPAQFFDRIDENHDGIIDEEEWNRRTRGGPGGGGGDRPRMNEQLSKFLDTNNDGKLTRDEFAHITKLFEVLDRDHNSEVSTEEMGRFSQAVGELKTEATGGVEVEALFDKLDKNKDSKLSSEEMANEKTFKALDLDRDGMITKVEAEKAMRQLKDRSSKEKPTEPRPEPPPPAIKKPA